MAESVFDHWLAICVILFFVFAGIESCIRAWKSKGDKDD